MIEEERGRHRCRLTVTIKFPVSVSGGPSNSGVVSRKVSRFESLFPPLETDMFGGGTGPEPATDNGISTFADSWMLQTHNLRPNWCLQ